MVNPLSVSVQHNGKKRLILDLRHVNKCLKKHSFKYEDWRVGLSYFERESYMFSFDLKSGYHHIEIERDYQTYLGLAWKLQRSEKLRYFVFTVLPFGLSTAPYIFTKCVRPIEKYWRLQGIKVAIYLDDGFIVEGGYPESKDLAMQLRHDLDLAGFVTNEEKSVWEPQQIITWLGLCWNAIEGLISVTQNRVEKILRHIESIESSNYVISARQLASFTGKIISTGAVVGNISRIMTRHCAMSIAASQGWESVFKLDEYSINEILFWNENIKRANIRYCFCHSTPNCFVSSDASSTGCSGHTILNQEYICHNMWTEEEKRKSSTWRELYAIEFALKSFDVALSNSHVKWFTDNQAAAKIVEVGSMKRDLHAIAIRIFRICIERKILLDIQWVPQTQVERADFLSRLIDIDDWQITPALLERIELLWGPHSIDCFANHYNHKLERFFSRFWTPGCVGIDFFVQNVGNENCLLIPPVCLIPRTLLYMRQQKAVGILIVPFWPSASFWPLLIRYQECCMVDYRVFEGREVLEHGRNKNSLLGSERFKGRIIATRINFPKSDSMICQ